MTANVFCDRVEAIPTGSIFGKCSFCVFRNMKLFCNKLSPVCTYISSTDDDFYGSVYWKAKKSGDAYGLLGCRPPEWAKEFFAKIPTTEIQKIAGEKVINALAKQKQK